MDPDMLGVSSDDEHGCPRHVRIWSDMQVDGTQPSYLGVCVC